MSTETQEKGTGKAIVYHIYTRTILCLIQWHWGVVPDYTDKTKTA